MKTIEQAAKEYSDRVGGDNFAKIELQNSFEAGVEFAQTWIPIEEELPQPMPSGEEVMVLGKVSDGIIFTCYHECGLIPQWVMAGTGIVIRVKYWRPIELK